jgi:TPP-dependent trihydroxycyclohexane-1,2-dione (THcHDO) dehydratase
VINSGPQATQLLRELVSLTGFPITSTLMGLGAYPASGENWLGMLGMHGTYEANMAMHDCDLMINIGARFDDRITGRTTRSRRAPRKSTSISTRPRSTRTSTPTCRSSAMSAMFWRIWSALAVFVHESGCGSHEGLVEADRYLARRAIRLRTSQTAMSSCRNTPFSGCMS